MQNLQRKSEEDFAGFPKTQSVRKESKRLWQRKNRKTLKTLIGQVIP